MSYSYPNTSSNSNSTDSSGNSSGSSVWSSPNIGQMTEMSQDWYRKMLNDADQLKISFGANSADLFQVNQQTQLSNKPKINTKTNNFSSNSNESIESYFPFNSFSTCGAIHPHFADIPDIPNFSSPQLQPFTSLYITPEDSSLLESSRNGSVLIGSSPVKKCITRAAPTRGRKYHNSNVLAQCCQKVLNLTAHPGINQIAEIVHQLKGNENISSNAEKKLRSSVREWFRKRREYMATKIYRSCERLLPKIPSKQYEIDEFIKSIHSNHALIGIIMLESKLPMQSEKERINFVTEKITDYYLKYPQRKLRNSGISNTNRNNTSTNNNNPNYHQYYQLTNQDENGENLSREETLYFDE